MAEPADRAQVRAAVSRKAFITPVHGGAREQCERRIDLDRIGADQRLERRDAIGAIGHQSHRLPGRSA